jgi:hypothetical protein
VLSWLAFWSMTVKTVRHYPGAAPRRVTMRKDRAVGRTSHRFL